MGRKGIDFDFKSQKLMRGSRMARTIAQLDYAKVPNVRREKVVRRAIWVTGALLIALAGWKFVGPAWDHLRLLQNQSRCLSHSEPADKIVYGVDVKPSDGGDWGRFYSIFSPPGGRRDAVLFLHELRRPDGMARLVAVELALPHTWNALTCSFDSTVIEPGGVWSAARLRWSGIWSSPLIPPIQPQNWNFRFYAGQPDPTNLAHFTVDFEYRGKRGTIDGWLQDDDTILFEPRSEIVTYGN